MSLTAKRHKREMMGARRQIGWRNARPVRKESSADVLRQAESRRVWSLQRSASTAALVLFGHGLGPYASNPTGERR